MPQRDLTYQRIDVGVLQESGKRMPPALGAGDTLQADCSRSPDEGVSNPLRLQGSRITPNASSKSRELSPFERPAEAGFHFLLSLRERLPQLPAVCMGQ